MADNNTPLNPPSPAPPATPLNRHVLGTVQFEPQPGTVRGSRQLGTHLSHITTNRGEPAAHVVRELHPPVSVRKERHFTRPPAKVARSATRTVRAVPTTAPVSKR